MGTMFSGEDFSETDGAGKKKSEIKTKPVSDHTIKPLVVVGPSGVGKGTLLGRFREAYEGASRVCVSHTTRGIREGERDGVHYHFVTREKFEALIAEKAFIEYADVHKNYYGTSFQSVKDVAESGAICFLEIDYQGALSFRESDIECNYIFITCKGGIDTLRTRLEGRESETEETIKNRLATALKEFEFYEQNKDFFDATIVNDDLEKASQELIQVLSELYPELVKL